MGGGFIAVVGVIVSLAVFAIIGIACFYNRRNRTKIEFSSGSPNENYRSKEHLLNNKNCNDSFTIELSPEGYSVDRQSASNSKTKNGCYISKTRSSLKLNRNGNIPNNPVKIQKRYHKKDDGNGIISAKSKSYQDLRKQRKDDSHQSFTDMAVYDLPVAKSTKRKSIYKGVTIRSDLTTPIKKHLTQILPNRRSSSTHSKLKKPKEKVIASLYQSPPRSDSYGIKQPDAISPNKQLRETVDKVIKFNSFSRKGIKSPDKNQMMSHSSKTGEKTVHKNVGKAIETNARKSVKEIVEAVMNLSDAQSENNIKIKLSPDELSGVRAKKLREFYDKQHEQNPAFHNLNASGKTPQCDKKMAMEPDGRDRHKVGTTVDGRNSENTSYCNKSNRLLKRESVSDSRIKSQDKCVPVNGIANSGHIRKVPMYKPCLDIHDNMNIQHTGKADILEVQLDAHVCQNESNAPVQQDIQVSSCRTISQTQENSKTGRTVFNVETNMLDNEASVLNKKVSRVDPLADASSLKNTGSLVRYTGDMKLCAHPALPSINNVYCSKNSPSQQSGKPISSLMCASPTFTSTTEVECQTVSSDPLFICPLSPKSPTAPKPPNLPKPKQSPKHQQSPLQQHSLKHQQLPTHHLLSNQPQPLVSQQSHTMQQSPIPPQSSNQQQPPVSQQSPKQSHSPKPHNSSNQLQPPVSQQSPKRQQSPTQMQSSNQSQPALSQELQKQQQSSKTPQSSNQQQPPMSQQLTKQSHSPTPPHPSNQPRPATSQLSPRQPQSSNQSQPPSSQHSIRRPQSLNQQQSPPSQHSPKRPHSSYPPLPPSSQQLLKGPLSPKKSTPAPKPFILPKPKQSPTHHLLSNQPQPLVSQQSPKKQQSPTPPQSSNQPQPPVSQQPPKQSHSPKPPNSSNQLQPPVSQQSLKRQESPMQMQSSNQSQPPPSQHSIRRPQSSNQQQPHSSQHSPKRPHSSYQPQAPSSQQLPKGPLSPKQPILSNQQQTLFQHSPKQSLSPQPPQPSDSPQSPKQPCLQHQLHPPELQQLRKQDQPQKPPVSPKPNKVIRPSPRRGSLDTHDSLIETRVTVKGKPDFTQLSVIAAQWSFVNPEISDMMTQTSQLGFKPLSPESDFHQLPIENEIQSEIDDLTSRRPLPCILSDSECVKDIDYRDDDTNSGNVGVRKTRRVSFSSPISYEYQLSPTSIDSRSLSTPSPELMSQMPDHAPSEKDSLESDEYHMLNGLRVGAVNPVSDEHIAATFPGDGQSLPSPPSDPMSQNSPKMSAFPFEKYTLKPEKYYILNGLHTKVGRPVSRERMPGPSIDGARQSLPPPPDSMSQNSPEICNSPQRQYPLELDNFHILKGLRGSSGSLGSCTNYDHSSSPPPYSISKELPEMYDYPTGKNPSESDQYSTYHDVFEAPALCASEHIVNQLTMGEISNNINLPKKPLTDSNTPKDISHTTHSPQQLSTHIDPICRPVSHECMPGHSSDGAQSLPPPPDWMSQDSPEMCDSPPGQYPLELDHFHILKGLRGSSGSLGSHTNMSRLYTNYDHSSPPTSYSMSKESPEMYDSPNGGIRISNDDINTANDGIRISNDDLSTANDGIRISNDDINTAKDDISSANDDIRIPNETDDRRQSFEKLSLKNTANDGIRISNDDLSTANDGIRISNDDISTAKDDISSANDDIRIPNETDDRRQSFEKLSLKNTANDGIRISNDDLRTANDGIRISNDDINTANDGIRISNDDISTANDGLRISNDDISTANDGIRISNDDISTANDDIRIPNETDDRRQSFEKLSLKNKIDYVRDLTLDTDIADIIKRRRAQRYHGVARDVFSDGEPFSDSDVDTSLNSSYE